MKLTASQRALLSDLGIPVWRARGKSPPVSPGQELPQSPVPTETTSRQSRAVETAAPTEPPAAAPTEPAPAEPVPAKAAPAVQPIHFGWTRLRAGIVLHPPSLDKGQQQFVRDVLTALKWRLQPDTKDAGGFTTGEFRWPQLENSSGTPQRAMSAWFKKQFDQIHWVGIDAAVYNQYDSWPDNAAQLRVVELGDTFGAMTNAERKQELWRWLTT